ncbi:hypothetical protein NUW58_g6811 [Xylaria curta]|uniref:Uncharacterized protein n=1 Tax=Xylaria curta TaxID=42375 RepID=A0ACC1NR37_9PEZI|nr:hypothetical protein NUW58_g6811 [Xylaria curta]
MLLICQELGARRDFTTLYHCALLSRRVASIAVEQLYSILEIMDQFIEGGRRAARLWRSIILSSREATLYPYCAYTRYLSLGSLVECLDDLRLDPSLHDFFFDGLMQDFLVLQAKATRSRPPPYDIPNIVSKCTDSITQCIQALVSVNGTAVALTHLETPILPRDDLLNSISRLSSLTSLQLQDGSVLGAEAAGVLVTYCPNFAELTCLHCSGKTAAVDMATFFLVLHPNSLQRFEVFSQNTLDGNTLYTLNTHAKSLRVLHLRSLLFPAISQIHLLSDCTALESLIIEREPTDRSRLDAFSLVELEQVAKWISSCKALRTLSFNHVRDALPIVRQVLQAPEIRLFQLHIQDYQSVSEEIVTATWSALGQQDSLESLTIASQDSSPDGLVLAQHPELTDSICRLSNLVTLNLMQASVSSAEICRIAKALRCLEELSFGGDPVDNSILEHLSKLPKLVLLSINAVTTFTFENLRDFVQSLDPVGNRGIKVDLLNQWYEVKLTEYEETRLNQDFFADYLNGRIAINYPNDPDELHEADFSDSD